MKDKKKKTTVSSASKMNAWLWLAGILLLTAVLYAPMFQNQFTNWDDPGYIVNNKLITDLSWNGISQMFSMPGGFYGGNYHPLTALSNAIDYHFFKLKPGPYHLQNLVFHLLNLLLVFWVVRQLLSTLPHLKNLHEHRVHIALFAAFFFGIHPTHVESVAWLAERKDVLYTFFLLLALWQYISYTQTRRWLPFVLCLFFFTLSLLSKFSAATFPAVLLLVDLLQFRRDWGRTALEKLPFAALSVYFGIIALQTQEATINDISTPLYALPERLLVASRNIVFYLLYALIPFRLSCLHPFENAGELTPEYYACTVLLAGVLFLVWRFRANIFMWTMLAAFVATNLLTLQLLPVGKAVFAERYTYVPYIFLFTWLGYLFFCEWPQRLRALRYPALLLLSGWFCFSSFSRIKVWKDSSTLWVDATKKYPDSYYAWFSAGEWSKVPTMAIECYTKSITLNPQFPSAYINRSSALHAQGKGVEALADVSTAMKIQGKTLTNLINRGAIYETLKMNDSALADYRAAEKFDTAVAVLSYNMGNIYFDKADIETAYAMYSKAVRLDPTFQKARYNRAIALVGLRRIDEACADFNSLMASGYADARKAVDTYCRQVNAKNNLPQIK